MRSVGESFRVNLRFGKRTIPELINELSARNPYARAKFIRALALDGWRWRQGELGTVMQEAPIAISSSAFPGFEGSDDLQSLFGNAVRL